jgi:AraC-like DNA-binding protein
LLLIDSLARGAILGLIALWSWLLLRDHRHALAARLAVAMNLTITCHVLTTFPASDIPDSIDWIFELGSVTVPATFWLFARAWFNDEQRIGWLSWASIPWSMALVSTVMLTFEDRGALFEVSTVVLRTSMFGFALAGLWVAWRGREGDLIEGRRRMRLSLVAGAGAFVVLTNFVEVLVHRDLLGDEWRSFVEIGIAVLTFGFCAAMFGVRHPDLLGAPQRPDSKPAPALDPADPLAVRLKAYMLDERPYRDEGLTIAALAARLGEQEYRLRRLINGSLGHRNFAQFLNGYRLDEVRGALADPAQREVPILTIALDAGFGSLGPFNRAFRDAECMTPSEYRSRALKEPLADSGIG